MYLSSLYISDFRCLDKVQLLPDSGINLILGENGAGKTSILEALFCLSRGRSFRAKQLQKAIQDNKPSLIIRAKLQTEISQQLAIQVSRGTSSSETSPFLAKIDGEEIKSRVELNRTLPSILMDPGIHKLIEEGPGLRRQYLDWGVFHVEPLFIQQWRRFQKTLKQRNQALKNQTPENQLKPWNEILVESGEFIHTARQDYLAHIAILAQDFASDLLGKEIRFSYRAGWAEGYTLAEAMEKSHKRERQLGTTVVGPHRADLIIQVGGQVISVNEEEHEMGDSPDTIDKAGKFHRARQRVSRGQQKLIASAMILAQAEHFKQHTGTAPILLVDDPFAELDNQHAARLLEKIAELDGQSFITALNPLKHPLFESAKTFYVEHGRIA